MPSPVTFTAQRGLSLLGDEKGAWMADTTAETLVGSDLVPTTNFAGTLTFTGSEILWDAAALTIGEYYIIEFNVATATAGTCYLQTTLPTNLQSFTGTGSHVVTFVADTTNLKFYTTDFNGTVDGVTVRLAVPDLSTNANGLGVYGSITKAAVATGADLVAYSGFSSSNYLEQPYNSDLDFGTGDFCIMGWLSGSAESLDVVLSKSPAASITSPYFELQTTATGALKWVGNGSTTELDSAQSIAGLLTHVALVRSSGVLYMYINGALNGSVTNTDNYDHSNAGTLRFGYRQDGYAGVFVGDLSLWKIDAVGRTAAQIKTRYNKEKHLFRNYSYHTQEGESYSIDLPTAQINPSVADTVHTSKSADGSNEESLLWRGENVWDIATPPIERKAASGVRVSHVEELMYATRNKETFTIDLYDDGELTTVSRESKGYRESRAGQSGYLSVAFKVRER